MAETQNNTPAAPSILSLRRNIAGRQAGETFTSDQAKATGIDAAEFAPFTGEVTDRAIKAPRSRK
jgi:hypothetical protein